MTYLLLLLADVFFSPPWLERLLLAPPDALARLDDDLVLADGLRLDEDSEDLLPDFMMLP